MHRYRTATDGTPVGGAFVGGATRGDYVQDERYIAIEHMAEIVPDNSLHFLHPWRSDVRRDWFSFAHPCRSDACVAIGPGLYNAWEIATSFADRSYRGVRDRVIAARRASHKYNSSNNPLRPDR